jgi:MAF protein
VLVLASSSPYRRALMERLGLDFVCDAPDIDETAEPDESATATAARLARAKADAVAVRHPKALVIGSDQVVECAGLRLGKPGDPPSAIRQLTALSGRVATFYTGLCLLDAATGEAQVAVEPYQVVFRSLSHREIERYVTLDKPFDCAGAFRSEGLGVALVERFVGDDPNALVGLPLIRLVTFLRHAGVSPLAS